jgi:hypothetical protein
MSGGSDAGTSGRLVDAGRRCFLAIAGLTALGSLLPFSSRAAPSMSSTHAVLLGDSTLDNAAYVPARQDVLSHLKAALPGGARATLVALDGATIADIERQLDRLPADPSHLIVSVGGNDALRHTAIFGEPARSMAEALGRLADIRATFEAAYKAMLDAVLRAKIPTAIATVYDGALPDPELRRIARPALAALNDCITREAAIRGIPLLDLRTIFDSEADYANPIEPSSRGGRKLAAAITRLIAMHDFERNLAAIFGPSAARPS